jgi:hypothetical protein
MQAGDKVMVAMIAIEACLAHQLDFFRVDANGGAP